jgi:hypothetical protein
MNKALQFAFSLLVSCLSFSGIAQALPDMTSDAVSAWFQRNRSIEMENGTTRLAVLLNAERNVEAEFIDYRPKCYLSADCVGTMLFQKVNSSGGQIEGGAIASGDNLIKKFWGQKILDDFKTSTLVETVSDSATKRWYQGKIYNYETWHDTDCTIASFGVVSKKSDQIKRIQDYKFCVNDPSSCDPS